MYDSDSDLAYFLYYILGWKVLLRNYLKNKKNAYTFVGLLTLKDF